MRKTKIICTIGPASSSEEVLRKMALAGMNVARVNFSHGTHEEQKVKFDLIKKVREELQLPIAIMLDTKGPEYRSGLMENGPVELKEGDDFIFTTDDIRGNSERVSVSYKNLHNEMNPGDIILVNNGLLRFEVKEVRDHDIITKILAGGRLSDRKSMSFPNKVLNQVFLSEQDKSDILFGIQNGIDFIACSFVSTREDIHSIKEFCDNNGGSHISLIAKIENQPGVDNIREICEECSGIMIGRGDMGVEISMEKLPSIQKHLISECRLLGKRVITATEMLESMINNIRPTRAEVSDVANAVYDGTSAIMLSGESAAGKHPVEAVETMSRIAEEAEKNIDYTINEYAKEFTIHTQADAVSYSICQVANIMDAKAIVVWSITGRTARMISRFRPSVDIIGLTTNEHSYRQMALSWGITPVLVPFYDSTEIMMRDGAKNTAEHLNLKKGDNIIITSGMNQRVGKTNMIKIATVGDED